MSPRLCAPTGNSRNGSSAFWPIPGGAKPFCEIEDDLARFLREAEGEEIIITRHGKPAGLLIGFRSEEDWRDHRLEHDPRFLCRVEQARES